ncbi:hypothetical protein BS47DRAFT_151687 [Hydnum rufescens UP504]|uniref:Uncharacterized protein n=1 Tax=Hydnum rufescens UP504 TaxID=1448309 RepID=A0A9P6AP87_9AGAM|nr:hypothetical protein BS47DRAFT_151687 [Hydnum rufescens UP504]
MTPVSFSCVFLYATYFTKAQVSVLSIDGVFKHFSLHNDVLYWIHSRTLLRSPVLGLKGGMLPLWHRAITEPETQ